MIYQDANPDFSEALHSLQTMLQQRDKEVETLRAELLSTKSIAQREQRLIASAWYELGLQFQRQAAASLEDKKTNPSWLQTQRQSLAEASRRI